MTSLRFAPPYDTNVVLSSVPSEFLLYINAWLSGNWFLLNAEIPIEVTPVPIETSFNWLPVNAYFPIEVTLSGIVTLVNWLI